MTYFDSVPIMGKQISNTTFPPCNKEIYVPKKDIPVPYRKYVTLCYNLSEYNHHLDISNSNIFDIEKRKYIRVEKSYTKLALRAGYFADLMLKMKTNEFNQIASMLNAISVPMVDCLRKCKDRKEIEARVEVVPTVILWYLKRHRKDLLQQVIPNGKHKGPTLEKLLDEILSARGMDLKKIESRRSNDYMFNHYINKRICYMAAENNAPK